jgi:GNAT superfamily N-acetyltransferase
MDVQYLCSKEKTICAKELKKLYQDAGWWEDRTEEDLDVMLKREIAVGAWLENTLIGFARAVTDGRFRAYIEDVVVLHTYQKSGIGKKLVTRLLDELTHIDIISLFCEEDLIPFYEKNKFKHSKSQFVMHRK